LAVDDRALSVSSGDVAVCGACPLLTTASAVAPLATTMSVAMEPLIKRMKWIMSNIATSHRAALSV
jgi:hypothetical protein